MQNDGNVKLLKKMLRWQALPTELVETDIHTYTKEHTAEKWEKKGFIYVSSVI